MENTIVVDTSVLISALIGKKGPGREVLRQCLLGFYKPLISNALFQEYEDVSKRDNIRKKCPLTDKEINELINAYYSVCTWVPIYYLWRPNVIDKDDDFLIELAIAGNAGFIVTNNVRDFAKTELKFPEVKIVTPEVFLRGE